jgi:hypothetical protein
MMFSSSREKSGLAPRPSRSYSPSIPSATQRSAQLGLVHNSDQLTSGCVGLFRKTLFLYLKYCDIRG